VVDTPSDREGRRLRTRRAAGRAEFERRQTAEGIRSFSWIPGPTARRSCVVFDLTATSSFCAAPRIPAPNPSSCSTARSS